MDVQVLDDDKLYPQPFNNFDSFQYINLYKNMLSLKYNKIALFLHARVIFLSMLLLHIQLLFHNSLIQKQFLQDRQGRLNQLCHGGINTSVFSYLNIQELCLFNNFTNNFTYFKLVHNMEFFSNERSCNVVRFGRFCNFLLEFRMDEELCQIL